MRNHNILPYSPDARKLATQLRQRMTPAEKVFWSATKKSKLGIVMRRQVPILDYVVDFYVKEIGLVIEIDGSSHHNRFLEDSQRQHRIEKLGVRFIRFTNKEVTENLSSVLKNLTSVIKTMKH